MRVPQFKPIGVPTNDDYREQRKLPRGVSIASKLDDRVEDVRAAAEGGDFDLYIAAQGGANVPRDTQTVWVARKVADELNAYDEKVQKVVGIFVTHLVLTMFISHVQPNGASLLRPLMLTLIF